MEQLAAHPLYKVHTIDSAMNSLWEFYKKRFVILFITSFVMGLIIQYLASMINVAELQSITDINEIISKLKDYLWPMVIVSLVSLLFTTILQYYIINDPLDTENNILKSALNSLRYYIPYLIIMVLLVFAASFILFLGFLMLVIGIFFAAIYVMTIYLFILPILIVEGPNISNAISRTLTFVHRNFWSNIGWTAVFAIIILVVSMILSGVILLPFTGSFLKVLSNPEEASTLADITTKPVYIVFSALLNALTFPLPPIFACILYFNARAREEQKPFSEFRTDINEGKVRVEDLYAKPIEEIKEEEKDSTNKL